MAAAPQLVSDDLGNAIKGNFVDFIEKFSQDSQEIYIEAIKSMTQNELTTLYVDYQHVLTHSVQLATSIQKEYYRFDPFLRQALRESVGKRYPDYLTDDKDQARVFYVAFHNLESCQHIRELKTDKIGTLITIRAVHPELLVGTFQCQDCRTTISNVEQQFKYTEFVLNISQFVDFQKVRAQEGSEEIPSGSMPRSVDIILRHEAVEKVKAGDKALFTGTLIVVPDIVQLSGGRAQLQTRGQQRGREGYSQEGLTGLKALGVRDLSYKLAFLASMAQQADQRAGQVNVRDEDATLDSVVAEMSEAERKDDTLIYQKLAKSIAPAIFGHEEIKRGILLMLFGGVHKDTADGISLRGDINLCIVGDPSTAKSQFLKYVAEFVPRAVYTSGKASSAAGLTAAVIKDEDSNEFFIEAGALMLADNGICCIDEFDKMDLHDQVAIHEAMEQQTISITKAGIQATLNARTSVLAAANPINGRYDKAKSLKSNVAMTGPIMSRFDLFFVIMDECNEVADYNIATHITNVHRLRDGALHPDYTTEEFARTLKPQISKASEAVLVNEYKRLRQSDAAGTKSSSRITVRQLESMIRLSEALARLYCDEEIKPPYVKEACRLLQRSVLHVETEDLDLDEPAPAPTPSNNAATETAMEGVEADDVAPKATSISYTKYRQIASMIVRHLRQREEMSGGAEIGMMRKDVVAWYLKEMESELESEAQATDETRIVRLVITRLVSVDRVLLEVEPDADMEGTHDDPLELKVLVVHPNYVDE